MKPSQVKKAIKAAIKAGLPCFIWGSPGVGKSQIVKQVADDMGLELRDVRAVLLDPVDLRGIPKIEGNICTWTIPSFLPREGKGILFLDELNAAPPLIQAACYQLVLDRRLGEYFLPEGWIIIAAGNHDSDRAVTTRMSSALKSRFVQVLEFSVNLDDWVDWALGHAIRAEIIAFMRYRPDLLMAFDPTRNEKAYACPRTWEFASRLLNAGMDADIEFDMLSGTVGAGAATEFIGFLRICRDLPDVDSILRAPDKADVPQDSAVLYALCGCLSRKVNANNAKAAIAYANRLPAEFSVLLVKDIIRMQPTLLKSQAFISWGVEHQDILL